MEQGCGQQHIPGSPYSKRSAFGQATRAAFLPLSAPPVPTAGFSGHETWGFMSELRGTRAVSPSP